MISEDRAELAVEFLRDTSEQYGQLCGRQAHADMALRRVKALQMLEITGSLGDREAHAYASAAYAQAIEELENATAERETVRAKRQAAELTIEVWRSQTSARKAGFI